MLESASQGGLPGLGGSAPGGLPGPGGSAWSGGVCLVQGVCLVWGVAFSRGVASHHALRQTPPVNRMTDRCKNITLATTSLRPVKIINFGQKNFDGDLIQENTTFTGISLLDIGEETFSDSITDLFPNRNDIILSLRVKNK